MRNITVSVDDETYRQARIRAAEMDTSVSALVRKFLSELTDAVPEAGSDDTVSVRRMRGILEVREDIRRTSPGFRVADNVPREDLYDRHASR
ncbi:MAG: hypothetical protein OXG27_09845 [Chloroflexi bacterium]|nr:hypothetical protein [Chloroflexota bacterium]